MTDLDDSLRRLARHLHGAAATAAAATAAASRQEAANTAAATLASHLAASNPHSQYVLAAALAELIDDRVAALLVEGANVTLTYDDTAGTLTIAASGGASAGLPWIVVTDYGAVGDGTTDDSAAVQDAVDAYNAAGGGVLYFPAGIYTTSGGYTLSKPGLILGDGCAEPNAATWVSAVSCTSATAKLFTVAHDGVTFRGLHLRNTAGSTPTAGAAISAETTADGLRIDACSVRGFYINVDLVDGAEGYITDSSFYSPVLYGLKVRHVDLVDAGDHGIVNCQFIAETHNATAAIRWESGGGLRLVGCKINARGSARFTYGLDASFGSGVETTVLIVTGGSFENTTSNQIRIVVASGAIFGLVTVAGCEFAQYGYSQPAILVNSAGVFDQITVAACVMRADSSSAAAISLTGVDGAAIGPVTIEGYASRLAQSGCAGVVDLQAGGDPTLGGDLSGTASAAVVEALQGNPVSSAAPAAGDVLTWDGAQWESAAPASGGGYSILTNGDLSSPELVFADGDVILVPL